MRPSRIALFALAFGALTACSAPATEGGQAGDIQRAAATTPTGFGPGDYCADTNVLLQTTTRANFSLGSEYYRNGQYCEAYPYIRNILETDPLFTGEDPDDRNYLRMASIYEDFAAQVDSTDRAERVAYLDSALAARRMGVEAMRSRNIAYDPYLRDLREGFFYFQNSAYYPDAQQKQFDAFSRALQAQPDSLEDWYATVLFAGSADQFGEEAPNPERAQFVRRLAEIVDDPALKKNYQLYADYLIAEPQASFEAVASTEGTGGDPLVQSLLDDLYAGRLSGQQRVYQLYATADQQPERITALGRDPDEVVSRLLRLPEIENNVDNPGTLYALSNRAYREGNRARGDELFNRAIANAASNAQRADFFYSRGAGRYGSASDFTRALEYFPSHGPSLYRRAGLIGDAVGRQSSLRGRFAYWCLADIYRNVAAASSGTIRDASRRAAAQYERAGPTREQYFLEGFRPGQSVTASLGAYGSCTTRVR